MLAFTLQVPAWVPVTALGVSGVSVVLAIIALLFTLKRDQREKERDQREKARDQREKERDRKKVEIVSSTEIRSEVDNSVVYYCCTVTNTGVPGVEIRSVGLRSHSGAGAELPLEPGPGQKGRVLVQGASQVWCMPLAASYAPTSDSDRLEVVAVVTDTAGDEYIQDQSKSLPLPLRG